MLISRSELFFRAVLHRHDVIFTLKNEINFLSLSLLSMTPYRYLFEFYAIICFTCVHVISRSWNIIIHLVLSRQKRPVISSVCRFAGYLLCCSVYLAGEKFSLSLSFFRGNHFGFPYLIDVSSSVPSARLEDHASDE